MTTVHIEIDGETLEVPQGQMIIEAADAAGIPIPRFCYHNKLSIAANCRMCLVDVANAPKALPACATPCSEGMKVCTTSAKAKEAQRAVMEFLLINHPLDCPICDQGGQCELQDVALEYGQSSSRYSEGKRVVKDKNLGPLISTEMTRCIHCTRCVRFGTEIAGMREMGATGRGEFMEIGTYIEHSVDSELSGNIIDLCPVGALTSKPFRFTARAWELKAFSGISMHDCVGSNLYFHALNNKVMRALPRDNEQINEVWLSDRDRFSYVGLNHSDRLQTPHIKVDGVWEAVDWETALKFAVDKLSEVVKKAGPEQVAAVASANSTLEEFYLLQKLFRALGCHNIDHRTRQTDFAHQAFLGAFPHLGVTLSELEHQDAIVLVGSDIRKEQPMIAHRLRKATLHGSKVFAVSPCEMDFNFECQQNVVCSHANMIQGLLDVIQAVAVDHPKAAVLLPPSLVKLLEGVTPSEAAKATAQGLKGKSKVSVIMGQYGAMHPQAHQVYALSRWLAHLLDATWGEMSAGANSAGGWLAGAVPHRLPLGQESADVGLNAHQMWQQPRKAYVLMNCEPEYDSATPRLAMQALKQASAVVVLSAYDNKHYRDYADVLLPMTPPSEMSGTYVNAYGEWQGFQAAVMPLGESRPAWKILRVLANIWEVRGFGYESVGEVLEELLALRQTHPHYADNLISMPYVHAKGIVASDKQLIRLAPVPLYAVDGITRRSQPLQETKDAQCNVVKLHSDEAKRHQVTEGQSVWVVQDGVKSTRPLSVIIDNRIPLGAAWVASGIESTHTLGEPFGLIEFIPS
jgi:NADH-quinone oxidoreductase subunit G